MNKNIGLALSGGGFRAAAFHLGTLKKLHALKILEHIKFISTISGGSIIGAYYTLHKDNYESFEKNFIKVLKKNIVIRTLFLPSFLIRILFIITSVCLFYYLTNSLSWTIVFLCFLLVLIGCFFYKIFPTTNLVKKIYDSLIYEGKLLKDLPDSPKLVINSTNLDTGSLFSFTKHKAFDSSYNFIFNKKIEFDSGDFLIAEAVASSTSVPYFFSPTNLSLKVDDLLIKPKLVDGGVYDNQGIYRIATNHSKFKSDIIIVSDASFPFDKKYLGTNPLPVLNRIMSVMMKRIKGMQFLQKIYENNEDELYEIGYFSIDWNYEQCIKGFINAVTSERIRTHLIEVHEITKELSNNPIKLAVYIKRKIGFDEIIKPGLNEFEIQLVKNISTSLKSLSSKEIDLLMRHAEVLTEIQIKLYCPSLVI